MQSAEDRKLISSIAMLILLLSWGMFFATLFMGYIVLRVTADSWPPMGMERIPLLVPALSTAVIALSSFTYFKFEEAFKKENFSKMKFHLVSTLSLGLLFMWSQFYLWDQMETQGIYTSSGIFASVLYSFTWIHAAHIVLGLIGLIWLLFFVHSFQSSPEKRESPLVVNIGKFWHFLDGVWVTMFIGLFVI